MQIDPLKRYVEENRAAFDHLEPPAFVPRKALPSAGLKVNLGITGGTGLHPEEHAVKRIPLVSRKIWYAAASLLIAVSTLYLVNRQDRVAPYQSQIVQRENNAVLEKNKSTGLPETTQKDFSKQELAVNNEDDIRLAKLEEPQNTLDGESRNGKLFKAKKPVKTVYDSRSERLIRLENRESSTTRLAALLEIDQAGTLDKKDLKVLANILNTDENSNVRLAALNVLAQYADHEMASGILVESLSRQDDPIVQLGLIGILSKQKDHKIEASLHKLAEDPKTFRAVRDEAYTILLQKNKI